MASSELSLTPCQDADCSHYLATAATPPGPPPTEPPTLTQGERPRDLACFKCALTPPFGWVDAGGETFYCKTCRPKEKK